MNIETIYKVTDCEGETYKETTSLSEAIALAKRVLRTNTIRVFVFIQWVENERDFNEIECSIDQWNQFRMEYNM